MPFFKKIKEIISEHPKTILSIIILVLLIGDVVFILPRSKEWGINLATDFISLLFFLYVVDFLLTLRGKTDKEILVRDITGKFKVAIDNAISKILNFFSLNSKDKEHFKLLKRFLDENLENTLRKFSEEKLNDYLELMKSLGTELSICTFGYEKYLRVNILTKIRNFQENIGKLTVIVENYSEFKNIEKIDIEKWLVKVSKEELEILLYLANNISRLVK